MRKVALLFMLAPLMVSAQDVYNVDVSANRQIVSQGVSGQGMLDRVSSSAFAKGSTYKQAVRDFGSGSLRWPNAGHDNLLITHWDNDHTIYYGAGDDYSTLSAGNIWDPLYNTNDAAPRTELIDLDAFVDVINATDADPVMLFTWRSAELWRVMGGTNNFYRDPAPLRMDGTVMPPSEANQLTSREMQFLENNRQLKNYYDLGGPDYPVVQIGGEVFIGWDAGQEPWKDLFEPDENKGEWIASTLRAYFDDLNDYAGSIGKNLKLMAQFKEADSGGHNIPTPVTFLRGEFDKLMENTGDIMTYYGCSMHYRHDWSTWLNQSNMTWGFIVDGGEGTAQEIQDWMRSYTAAAGYPGIELIPHANSIGSATTNMIPNNYSRAKQGLVNTQFLMELIEAGYPYACHYAGIKGEYTGSVGVNNGNATSFMGGLGYEYNPIVYASGLIGDAVVETNGRPARLIGLSLGSGNTDGKTQVMVIEPSAGQSDLAANGGTLDANVTQVLYAYVLNKRETSQTVSLDFSQNVQAVFEVNRYAEGAEETAPEIADPSGVVERDAGNKSLVHVTTAPLSMTRVKVFVKGNHATTNRPPKFKAPILFAASAKTGAAYSDTIASDAMDADGDVLTFVKTGGAAWLSVATNGVLSGEPSSGDLGLNNVSVEVTDGVETNDAVLRITVADNVAPVFAAPPIILQNATSGVAYADTLAGTAADADGDPLTYTKEFGPSWLIIATNGALSGTPGSGDTGANSWGVEVSDGNGGSDTATLNIFVAPAGGVSGFVGWDEGGTGAADVATLTGFSGMLSGGTPDGGVSSTDETWGSQTNTPAPSATGLALKVIDQDVVTIVVSNAAGVDLQLEGLFFDYRRAFKHSPKDLTVAYSAAALDVYSSAGHTEGDWVNHDVWLTDRTLANTESASFTITFSNATGTARGDLDNIMVLVHTVSAQTPYEAWASVHSLTNGPSGNDDGDALNNLYEYGLGGDPTNSAHLSIIPVTFERSGDAFEYIYPRRTAPDSGITYYLELTDDLVSGGWTNTGYTEVGAGDIDGTFESVTNEIPMSGKTNQFIRLIIMEDQ